ncbi:plasma membrane calcium, partial [Coemansia sp. RSA 1933]
ALVVDPSIGLKQREHLGAASERQHEPFQIRRDVFGKNALPKARTVTFLQLLRDAYNDHTLIMLTIASVVSLAVGIYDD